MIVIAALFSLTLTSSQFAGEDELLVLSRAEAIITYSKAIKVSDLIRGNFSATSDFIWTLISFNQPPARQLISIPFINYIDNAEKALRLPNIIFWIGTVIVGFRIGSKLSGQWCGFLSGLYLAGSGLFTFSGSAHSFGYYSFWIMIFVFHRMKNHVIEIGTNTGIKNFFFGNMCLFMAFLGFQSALPIVFIYNLMYIVNYIIEVRKGNASGIKRLWLFVPIFLIYGFYFAFFYGLPAYLISIGKAPFYFGQLDQLLGRQSIAYINYTSFLINLKAINGYFFPFFSWFLLIIGTCYLYKYSSKLFILLIPQALLFSFYFVGSTQEHFSVFFIWIIPMAVAGSINWFGKYSRAAFLLFFIPIYFWTYEMHVKKYTENDYPSYSHSNIHMKVNKVRPIKEIVMDIKNLLHKDMRYVVFVDGAIPLYYFKSSNYIILPEEFRNLKYLCDQFKNFLSKENVKLAIVREQNFCDPIVSYRKNYAGSKIDLVVFE